MRYSTIILSVLLWLTAATGVAQQRATGILQSKELQHASVGACVMDVATGQVVAQYEAQRAFTPASLTKIFTAATVLRLYPDTTRLYTRVGYTGRVQDGVLYGDIVVRGSADPSLGNRHGLRSETAFTDSVTAAVRGAGITRVKGRIVADASLCGVETQSQYVMEDVGWYYGAGCYGINYRGNSYDLYVRTGPAGSKVQIVDSAQSIVPLTYRNLLVAGDKDSSFVTMAPYAREVILTGKVPAGREKFRLPCSLPHPPLALATDVKRKLQAAGVVVEGAAVTDLELLYAGEPVPQATRPLMAFASDPLDEMVKSMLWRSDNLYAEALLRYIAMSDDGDARVTTGLRKVSSVWRAAGVDVQAMRLYDGCGLSRKNMVTPHMLASLLTHAYGVPQLGSRFASLFPIAGREGTVKIFMNKNTLPGTLRLKSGSMGGVLCYAGYYTQDRRTYAVVIMCNHHTCSNARVRRIFEQYLHAVL